MPDAVRYYLISQKMPPWALQGRGFLFTAFASFGVRFAENKAVRIPLKLFSLIEFETLRRKFIHEISCLAASHGAHE
jgi:hypothetical protein